jgi:uncharacterized protein
MGDLPVQLGSTRRLAPDAAVPAELRLPFHLLAKPSGPICNLDCQYCFFLSKEALYPGDRFRMGDDLVETYLRQLLDSQPDGTVVIAWQGGEPTLMGVDFFARAVETAERLRRPGQTLEHTIQTNGTLLDDAWGELLARHGFLVGLSIDGPPALHDAYRVDKRGEPTSAKVLRGWEVLRRHGVDVNVLCTVHAANQDHPLEVYRYLRDTLGAQHVQLIPIVEQHEVDGVATGELTERSVDPVAWGRFLITIFDEWLAHDVGRVFVQMFDAALGSWYGVGSSMCIFRPTCGDALALEHNGDVYSCDHFVDPEHLLGNIATTQMVELVRSPRQRAFGQAKADTLPEQCRRCDVRFACNGECPKNRISLSVDGEPGLNHLCAGYYEFFHHIDGPMRVMADLLRAGRAPAEFAAIVAAAGRNEPCPCGSGRKTKHCHG